MSKWTSWIPLFSPFPEKVKNLWHPQKSWSFFPSYHHSWRVQASTQGRGALTSHAAHQPSRAARGPAALPRTASWHCQGKGKVSGGGWSRGSALLPKCCTAPSPARMSLPQHWILSGGCRISTRTYLLISVKAQAFMCTHRRVKFSWKVWTSPFIRLLAHVVGFETQVPKPLLLPWILNSLWA